MRFTKKKRRGKGSAEVERRIGDYVNGLMDDEISMIPKGIREAD